MLNPGLRTEKIGLLMNLVGARNHGWPRKVLSGPPANRKAERVRIDPVAGLRLHRGHGICWERKEVRVLAANEGLRSEEENGLEADAIFFSV